MKLASHLWRSRHGIYYIRYIFNGREYRRSLGIRDSLKARSIAYKLGAMNADDLIKKLKNTDSKEWSLKTPQIEITTDGTVEDHKNAIQALETFLAHQPSQSTPPVLQTSSIGISIQKAVSDYLSERASSIAPRTLAAWKSDFNNLAIALKRETIVSAITPQIYTTWRIENVDHLAVKTQHSKYSAYRNFFEWCISMGYCSINPVTKLKLSKNRKEQLTQERGKTRLPYSASDLLILFKNETLEKIKKPCLYWMPLLALYTGARAEELANIDLSSIREVENGLWAMTISKSKTVSGTRDIPIHPALIKAGLLSYIDDLKKLWPEPTTLLPYMTPVNGRLTHRFSQDFGEHRKKLGIDPTKDFHSFRTTVIGRLKINNVRQDMREEFVGHESSEKSDVHNKNYASKTKYPLDQLAEHVFAALDFQSGDDSSLIIRNYVPGQFDAYLRTAKSRKKPARRG